VQMRGLAIACRPSVCLFGRERSALATRIFTSRVCDLSF